MDNLLSIGEVAKIRNINVQSLRYYEKLGVLNPAYINPETGYRYYSFEQLMILDTIILCIELGIPLKDLKNYVDKDGKLEFERLLRDGRALATEKIHKIETNLSSIDRTLRHINDQKNYMGREGYYSRFIVERQFVMTECERKMDARTYEKRLNELFDTCHKNGLQALFQHGIVLKYHGRECIATNMFLEVLPSDLSIVHSFAEGDYLCFQELREVHSDPLETYPARLFDEGETTVVISCMSPEAYKYDEVVLEFQLLQ